MQKDAPQPTDEVFNARVQMLGEEIQNSHNLAIDFLRQQGNEVKKLFCKNGSVKSEWLEIEATGQTLLLTVAEAVGGLVVAWLIATQPNIGIPASVVMAGATISALVAAIIVNVGIVAFCSFGIPGIT